MKKNFTVALIQLFLLTNANGQIKNDLTRDNLIGKIKSTTQTDYVAIEKFGEVQQGNFDIRFISFYDYKGNLIEENSYDKDGGLKGKSIPKYDEKGNQIELRCYNSDGSLLIKYTYKYDEKGNQIEVSTWGKTLWKKSINKYSENGILIEQHDGIHINFFKYDERGNTIVNSKYSNDGSLSYKYIYKYEYDALGNWEKKTKFIQYEDEDERPQEISYRVFEYY